MEITPSWIARHIFFNGGRGSWELGMVNDGDRGIVIDVFSVLFLTKECRNIHGANRTTCFLERLVVS